MLVWYGHNLSVWGWIGMTMGMLAFWGLVITGIVVLMRSRSRRNSSESTSSPRTPEQLLSERFARGEIDTADYYDRLETLRRRVRS